MRDRGFGIYQIVNLITSKIYLGATTVSFRERWWRHRGLLRRGIHYNQGLQQDWNKYGQSSFQWQVIEELSEKALVFEREQDYLDRLGFPGPNVYNVDPSVRASNIGRALKGRQVSSEIRQKLRALALGRIPSTEARKHMSQAQMGRKHSLASRRKRSRALKGRKGRPHTPEERMAVSRQFKGKPKSKMHVLHMSHPYPAFINTQSGEIISSGRNLVELCKRRGLDSTCMNRVKNGIRKHHKSWRLLEMAS